jgi:TolA-binding protein
MDLKDIQIQILTKTIGTLHGEIAELRACIIVQTQAMQETQEALNEIKKSIQEVQDGEYQDSPADESSDSE